MSIIKQDALQELQDGNGGRGGDARVAWVWHFKSRLTCERKRVIWAL